MMISASGLLLARFGYIMWLVTAVMEAFFAEEDRLKRDEIALRQLHVLREHQGPREETLRLSNVKAMFLQMKNQL
jgi:hypothetical protein